MKNFLTFCSLSSFALIVGYATWNLGCGDSSGSISSSSVSLSSSVSSSSLPSGSILVGDFSDFANWNVYLDAEKETHLTPRRIRITDDASGKIGYAWYKTPLDFSKSFEATFKVFLGAKDFDGADGIALLFSKEEIKDLGDNPNGAGLGYAGYEKIFAIEIDTFTNNNFDYGEYNDPREDHIGFMPKGNIIHSDDNKTVYKEFTVNIENNTTHDIKIKWDTNVKKFFVYWDDFSQVFAEYNMDIVSEVFSNEKNLYIGIAGTTGAKSNLQYFIPTSLVILNSNSSTSSLPEVSSTSSSSDQGSSSVSSEPPTSIIGSCWFLDEDGVLNTCIDYYKGAQRSISSWKQACGSRWKEATYCPKPNKVGGCLTESATDKYIQWWYAPLFTYETIMCPQSMKVRP